MKKLRNNSFLKRMSFLTAFFMIYEISFPTVVWALTGGPSQPEVQSFEPVGTTEMVDLTSGDFVYNIPLLDVGGYPINLSYHGGIDMEQEASWVGLGWNINPGVINRNLRGLPDDFKGDKVVRTLSTKPNWNVGLEYTRTKTWEVFGLKCGTGSITSKDLDKIKGTDAYKGFIGDLFTKSSKSLSFSLGINYNNYKGVGFNLSFGGAKQGLGGLNLGFSSSNGFNVGASVSQPNNLRSKLLKQLFGGVAPSLNFNSREGLQQASLGLSLKKLKLLNRITEASFNLGEVNSTAAPQPNFHSFGGSVSYAGGKVNIMGTFNQKNKFLVNFNTSKIKDKNKSFYSYGYLYQNNSSDVNPKDLKSDFSRVFDEPLNKSTMYMPLAQKTYDAFSASGQGTGSGIRLKESFISPIADPTTDVTSGYTPDIAIEFGRGTPNTHLGVDVAFSFQEGSSNRWTSSNSVSERFPKKYTGNQKWFEPAYFQSMGENVPIDKTMYTDLQGESYITCELSKRPDIKISSSSIDNAKTKLSERARRNQVTSYLTAENATLAGVTKKIENYKILETGVDPEFVPGTGYPTFYPDLLGNQKNFYPKTDINRNEGHNGNKKPHHLSEMTTLNPDGTRYVYGLPAYNYSTKEQTFAVNAGNDLNSDFDDYGSNELGTANNKGLDHFYLKEETPAYPHSFLLTAILL